MTIMKMRGTRDLGNRENAFTYKNVAREGDYTAEQEWDSFNRARVVIERTIGPMLCVRLHD